MMWTKWGLRRGQDSLLSQLVGLGEHRKLPTSGIVDEVPADHGFWFFCGSEMHSRTQNA